MATLLNIKTLLLLKRPSTFIYLLPKFKKGHLYLKGHSLSGDQFWQQTNLSDVGFKNVEQIASFLSFTYSQAEKICWLLLAFEFWNHWSWRSIGGSLANVLNIHAYHNKLATKHLIILKHEITNRDHLSGKQQWQLINFVRNILKQGTRAKNKAKIKSENHKPWSSNRWAVLPSSILNQKK